MSYSPEAFVAELRTVLENVQTELSATGRNSARIQRCIDAMPSLAATLRPQAARVDDLLPLAIKGWNEHQQRCRITTVEGSLRAALEAALSAQPAQAVDVGALQKVADDLACVARLTDHDLTRGTCQSASDRITRALSAEKAEGWSCGNLAERLERAEASAEHSRIMRESDRRALAIVIHHYVGGAAIITPAMLDEMPTGITRIDRSDIAHGAVELRTKENWRDFHEEVGADGKPTGYLIFPTPPTDEEE